MRGVAIICTNCFTFYSEEIEVKCTHDWENKPYNSNQNSFNSEM